MKTSLYVIFFLLSFTSFAQQVGIKAGGNYLLSSGDLKADYGKGALGYHVGLFVRDDKTSLNFIIEALYSMNKTKDNFEIHALNIPVLLETKGKLSLHGGINTSLHLSNKRTELFENQAKLRPFNFDAAAGLTFRPVEDFGFNIRALYPILNQSGDDERTYKPINFQLSISYAFKK